MTETLLEHLRMDEDGTDGSLPASQREDSGLGVCGGQHCLVDRLPELENSLRTIVNLLTQEISAAKDREARLLRKVKDLGSQLHSLQAAFERQQHLTSSATTNDDNASLTKLKPKKKYSKKYSKEGTSKKNKDVCSGSSDSERDISTNHQPSDCEPGREELKMSMLSQEHVPPKVLPPLTEADDTWQLVSATTPRRAVKRGVIWIGNLRPEISEESLNAFLSSRASACGLDIEIFNTKLFCKPSHATGARVTVNRAVVSTLTTPSFFPRPVYARQWVFKDQDTRPLSEAADLTNRVISSARLASKANQPTSPNPEVAPAPDSEWGNTENPTNVQPQDSETPASPHQRGKIDPQEQASGDYREIRLALSPDPDWDEHQDTTPSSSPEATPWKSGKRPRLDDSPNSVTGVEPASKKHQ